MRIHTIMGAPIDPANAEQVNGERLVMTPGRAMNAVMPRSMAIHISA
jgi:hypothetical protein